MAVGRVSNVDLNLLNGNPELAGNNRGERGDMALPAIHRRALDQNLAVRADAHLPAIRLPAHALSAYRRTLDIDAQPDAHVLPLRAAASLFSAQLPIVRGSQQGIQSVIVRAGVIGRAGGSGVGEGLGGDQVAFAYLNGVERE